MPIHRYALAILVTGVGTVVCPIIAHASQETLSAVRDILYTPSGEPFSGNVKIQPEHFGDVNPPSLSFTVEDAMFDLKLLPCPPSDLQAVYIVTFTSSVSQERWTETWRVPKSQKLALSDVRLNSSPSQNRDGATNRPRDINLPIPMTGVTGLSSDLNTFNNEVVTLTNQEQSLSLMIQSLTGTSVVHGEIPTGTVDGSNTTFSLAHIPIAGTLAVSLNGARLSSSVDFTSTANSSTITFVPGAVPKVGAILLADYKFSKTQPLSSQTRSVSLPIPISDVSGLAAALNLVSNSLSTVTQELSSLQASVSTLSCPQLNVGVILGVPNGATASFALPSAPIAANQVAVYRNGLRLGTGGDYTLSNSTVTFLAGGIPNAGDNVLADYCSAQQ